MPSAAGPPSSSAADDQPELPSLQEQLTRRRRRGPAPSALDFTRGRRRDRLLRIALVALLFLAVLPLSLGRLLSTRSESPPPPQRKPENSDPDPVPRPAPLPEAAGARGRSLPRLNPTRASATPERRQQAPEASRSPARPDRVVVAATTVAAGAGAQPGLAPSRTEPPPGPGQPSRPVTAPAGSAAARSPSGGGAAVGSSEAAPTPGLLPQPCRESPSPLPSSSPSHFEAGPAGSGGSPGPGTGSDSAAPDGKILLRFQSKPAPGAAPGDGVPALAGPCGDLRDLEPVIEMLDCEDSSHESELCSDSDFDGPG